MKITETDKEKLRNRLLDVGCAAVGFARAERVEAGDEAMLREWLTLGRQASMCYMERNIELRLDPRKLLSDCATVISMGIPYLPALQRPQTAPQVALYASGKDYHKQVVKMLRPVCRYIQDEFGAETRICVDSAPVAERYWALKAGMGRRGRNGMIYIPNYGSYIFLAEILTTLQISPDEATTDECSGCGACIRSCPGKALHNDGNVDASRCLSYLTIEHKEPFTEEQLEIVRSKEGRNTLYGCDICQRVCHLNRKAQAGNIEAFQPSPLWLSMDYEMILNMSAEEWDKLTRGSAMRRADFATMRNRVLNFFDSGNVIKTDDYLKS